MANKNVMEDIGLRKKETEEERAEKEESRRANLAEKVRVCEDRSDELKRRVYWILTCMVKSCCQIICRY